MHTTKKWCSKTKTPTKGVKLPFISFGIEKKKNLNHLRVWWYQDIEKVPEPAKKKLREKEIECIFIEYAEYGKIYSFMLIKPDDSYSVITVIESKDVIFDEIRFNSIPRHKELVIGSDKF